MFEFELTENKYYTLYENIRGEILRGKVRAGEKLPSKRALAESLGVSVVTVQLAYEQLAAERLFRRKRGGAERAAFLAAPSNTAAARKIQGRSRKRQRARAAIPVCHLGAAYAVRSCRLRRAFARTRALRRRRRIEMRAFRIPLPREGYGRRPALYNSRRGV